VHETLEKLYNDLKFQKLNSKEELLAFFDGKWAERWHNNIFIVKDYSPENYKEMGRKFVSDYYEHYKPFSQTTLIDLETQDILALNSENSYHIRIDRLSSDKEGNYFICDYKTNNSLKEQEELDEDRQLAMYSLWVKQKYPDAKSVKLVWFFLAFDKEMVSERNDVQLENLKKEIEELISQIELCSEFGTNVSSLCDYCSYKPMCPAWKHEIELEQKTPTEFKDDDGVRLVDAYSTLYDTKKKIEDDLDILKNAIIKFAQQKGLEVVFGTETKASIAAYDKIEYPKTEEFIFMLKERGIYGDVSTINTSKLKSLLNKRKVDVDLLQMIKTEQGWMVRIGKRRE